MKKVHKAGLDALIQPRSDDAVEPISAKTTNKGWTVTRSAMVSEDYDYCAVAKGKRLRDKLQSSQAKLVKGWIRY